MELLAFYLNNFNFGISTEFIETIDKISNIKININDKHFLKNNIKYKILDLYKLFYNKEREIKDTNDYLIFLKNKMMFRTEKLEKIFEPVIIKYDFSLFLDKKYRNLFSGIFILNNKIGLILNGKEVSLV